MRKLVKITISTALQSEINANIQKYAQLLIAGEVIPDGLKAAYRSDKVKSSLKIETLGKCAYCESRMLHVDYGDIEHIQPKGRNPHLTFSYENLTLSCGICNTKKAAHDDIINPYVTDPSDHLFALGPMIFRRQSSDLGFIAERRLDLNRTALLIRRVERLQAISNIANQIAVTSDATIRSILVDELKEEASIDGEFSMITQAYVSDVCVELGV